MNRPVKKLLDIEIDEVSVVDRPANQHGLIAIAKNAGSGNGSIVHQEDEMPVFTDADGVPVDADELEHGDLVYDEEGNEYVFSEEEDDEPEAEIEKGFNYVPASQSASAFAGRGRMGISRAADRVLGTGATAGKRKKALKYGGTAAAGAAAGFGAGQVGKSLGDSILEELSKAVNDDERNKIVAKAMDEVAKANERAEELEKALAYEQDVRLTEAFISKAAEYNLPVDPRVFGPILKAVAEVLDDEQLDILDAVLTSASDMLYDEIGYVGDTDNDSVINQVEAYANELVGKADISKAEAVTAMFAANPAAYEAYLVENGR